MRSFTVLRDKKHTSIIGIVPSDYINILVLSAGVAKSCTVPTGANKVSIKATQAVDLWINLTTTAIVPTVDITNGSGPMLNYGILDLTGVTAISVICATACIVTFEFFE